MKKEDFLSLMGGIDDRLIEKHAILDSMEERQKHGQKQTQRQRRQRWFDRATAYAVAAVILAFLGAAMLFSAAGIVKTGRRQSSPASLGNESDSQNREENDFLLKTYLSGIGVEAQEIQKSERVPEAVLLINGTEEQPADIRSEAYFVYKADSDEVLAVIAFDLPDEAAEYGCSQIRIADRWRQDTLSQADAMLYTKETPTDRWKETQKLYPFANDTYQLVIPETDNAYGKNPARIVLSVPVTLTGRELSLNGYQIEFLLKAPGFPWIRLAWGAAAIAVIAAALWFLNCLLELNRLRETDKKAGRFLFGRETEYGAVVESIENTDRINSAQYLTKNGAVSAGSSGRYHVNFRLQDDTCLSVSVSAKQAGTFEPGMRGTLVHRRNILISYVPEHAPASKKHRGMFVRIAAAVGIAGVILCAAIVQDLIPAQLVWFRYYSGNTAKDYGEVFLQNEELLTQSGMIQENPQMITDQDVVFCSSGVKQAINGISIVECYGVTNGGIYVTVYSKQALYEIEGGSYHWLFDVSCPETAENKNVVKATRMLSEKVDGGYVTQIIIPAPLEIRENTLTLIVTGIETRGAEVSEDTCELKLAVETIPVAELNEN